MNEDSGPCLLLTADEAIARLETWTANPPEELDERLQEAALAAADNPSEATQAELKAAAEAWRSARVERVQTATGSFGCAMDAEDVREALRASPMIIEVDGNHMFDMMLRSRGCRIAYQDADGTWRGVGSKEREQ